MDTQTKQFMAEVQRLKAFFDEREMWMDETTLGNLAAKNLEHFGYRDAPNNSPKSSSSEKPAQEEKCKQCGQPWTQHDVHYCRDKTLSAPPLGDWEEKARNILYDYGNLCVKAERGDIEAAKAEGNEINKLFGLFRDLLVSEALKANERGFHAGAKGERERLVGEVEKLKKPSPAPAVMWNAALDAVLSLLQGGGEIKDMDV